jgi:hypothetical protein
MGLFAVERERRVVRAQGLWLRRVVVSSQPAWEPRAWETPRRCRSAWMGSGSCRSREHTHDGQHDIDVRQVVVEGVEDEQACPACGVLSGKVHGRKLRLVKDLPHGRPPLRLWCQQRQWACRERACQRRTFAETSAQIGRGQRLTRRLREQLERAVSGSTRSATEVPRRGCPTPAAGSRYAGSSPPRCARRNPRRTRGVGLGAHQCLAERLHHRPEQVPARRLQLLVQPVASRHTGPLGHRVSSSQALSQELAEDHAVARPTSDATPTARAVHHAHGCH